MTKKWLRQAAITLVNSEGWRYRKGLLIGFTISKFFFNYESCIQERGHYFQTTKIREFWCYYHVLMGIPSYFYYPEHIYSYPDRVVNLSGGIGRQRTC